MRMAGKERKDLRCRHLCECFAGDSTDGLSESTGRTDIRLGSNSEERRASQDRLSAEFFELQDCVKASVFTCRVQFLCEEWHDYFWLELVATQCAECALRDRGVRIVKALKQ